MEPGEWLEAAAVRETVEKTGLVVTATQLLGERVHPKTGRRMAYVACDIISGTAYVADDSELADLAWVQQRLRKLRALRIRTRRPGLPEQQALLTGLASDY